MSGIGYFGPKRPPGYEEQPSINPSFLKLRLPFYHYPIEYQDFLQGAILSCVPLGITVAMEGAMGIPIELGVVMVMVNNFFYLWHTSFGDPSVAGWITPGIPIYVAYFTAYTDAVVGPSGVFIVRMQALIAMQFVVAAIFLILGATGVARSFVERVPKSITAGILLGAGLASIQTIFNPAQPYVSQTPISFLVSAFLSLFLLFSKRALAWRKQSKIFQWIAGFGIVPGFVIGYILGLITGEITVDMAAVTRSIIIPLHLDRIINEVSVFGVGFPGAELIGASVAVAIVAYIIAFGDVLILKALVKQADEARPDEKVLVHIGRNHIITGWRNVLMGAFFPYVPMCGPQWTGGQALVVQRYANSTPEQEYTYWGGATSIFWGMSIALLINPIVQIMLPARSIGFGLTLLIQGYLCSYLAMGMVENNIQRGIAGIMAGALIVANYIQIWGSPFFSAPAVGLAVGTILYLLLEWEGGKPQRTAKLEDTKPLKK